MKNGAIWPDDNGVHINAHGGSILEFDGVRYWYGEHKTAGWDGRLAWVGVHVYSSADLEHWTDRGIALAVVDDPASPICRGQRIERPKVIFCRKTGKFVMYFHSADDSHARAEMGVAVSDTPTGPFRFLYAERAEKGVWPLDAAPQDKDPRIIGRTPAWQDKHDAEWRFFLEKHGTLGRDFRDGQSVRDQTLFVDDDGKAYHIYASEDNSTMHIALLTDDYLRHSGEYVRVFRGRWQEAPILFKRDGVYYMMNSGCYGWLPCPAHGARAENIFGPWFEFENPCRGEDPVSGTGPETTFGCQGACAFSAGGRQYVMLDRWNMADFIDSRYVWLPVAFHSDGTFSVTWTDVCRPEL